MSGKRKKDNSEAVGIMKFFKSTERNTLSSKEPSDSAERTSIRSATVSVRINESTCSATSSPVDDHSSRSCGGTEQTTVIATPTITDVQGKGEITATFDEDSKLHNYYLCKSSDCCTINGPAVSTPEAKEVVKTAIANWLQKKNRRLQRPPISTNKVTTSPATLKPVLVDQGTQCDSLTAPLNAERLKLAEEQLQREVYLAKKAFSLLDQDSDSDSDSAWDSMSDMSDTEV